MWMKSCAFGAVQARTRAKCAGIVALEGGGTAPHPRAEEQIDPGLGRTCPEPPSVCRMRDCGAMRRELPGGYELDDDAQRIDVAEVHRYLSAESYWAAGRPCETVEALVQGATRVVGIYHQERQVGFARAVSDGHTVAYLADVYVLPAHRGRGLGKELVREIVDGSPFANVRWLLHTGDAHALYAEIGFGRPGDRLMERPTRG